MLKVNFLPRSELMRGANSYKDFYFLFECSYHPPLATTSPEINSSFHLDAARSLLLVIWTPVPSLAFTLTAVDKTLRAMDTFAPSPSWVVDRSLKAPPTQREGLLQFSMEFDEDGIATVVRENIQYRANPERKLVRIKFDRAASVEHVRVANCLMVGIDPEGNSLVEIWLEEVIGLSL